MKTINNKYKIRLAIIILIVQFSQSQITIAQNENYCSEYIRIWGIVKYANAYKASPIANLDSMFQKDIRQILANCDNKTFNRVVRNLLNYTGRFQIPQPVKNDKLPISNNSDSVFNWINISILISNHNKTALKKIITPKRNLQSPFVTNNPENNAALFTNEKKYIAAYPPIELRLLALARLWNAVYYFFPHIDIITSDWNRELNNSILGIIGCKNEFEYHLLISELAAKIGDGHGQVHSSTLDKFYGYNSLPCEVSYIDNQLFVTKIHKSAINNPFRFGDKIIEINDQSFKDFYSGDSTYIWGSNKKRKKNISASHFIRSRDKSNRVLKLVRNDSIIQVSSPSIDITTMEDGELISYKGQQGYQIGGEFIYVDLSIIDSTDFERLILLYKKPNIIIDLRTYPNWVLNQIGSLFVKDETPYATYQYPIISSLGDYCPPQLLYLKPGNDAKRTTYDRIILIVDYTTISRGEFLCMAFQSLPKVTTFGDKTAGADGDISKILLPGNISMQFTGLKILYPNGKKTQQIGVNLDIQHTPKGYEISAQEDEVLNYIIKSIIKKGKLE